MDEAVEARLARLESELSRLGARLERLERAEALPEAAEAARPAPLPPPEPPPRPPPPAARPRPSVDLEDLLGGRVLAWAGGLAVLIGVVLFLVMAVGRGWIDEPARVVLAFLGSTALLAVGLYLYERQGRTEAAVAAVSASIAALYASLTAATALYELVSPAFGLVLAFVIGASSTAIAVRWRSPLVAALGILGSLVSPVLVDAGTSGVALAFMTVALLSGTGVLLWQRWDWLATGAFLVSVPQLVGWLLDTYEERLTLALAVLLGFWALYVVAAAGYELRVPTRTLRTSSALLLLADAFLVAGSGWGMLHDTDHGDLATTWVLGLAVVHVGLGSSVLRTRISGQVAVLLLAVGVALSAVGLALALDGPVLVAAWSAEAALLAWVARRTGERRATVGAVGFLSLAALHILDVEAPPSTLRDGTDDLARALVAIAAFAAAALFGAWQQRGRPSQLRLLLAAAGATALVYLPSVAIVDLTVTGERAEPGQTPQVLLSAFWAATGLAAVLLGLLRRDRNFRLGGLALLGVAVVKVSVYDSAALEDIYRVLSFIALGLLLLVGAFAYQRLRATVGDEGEA